MPDLLDVLSKRWKFILGLAALAAIIGLVVSLLSPKKFLSTATALPANSLVADKARITNQNIEALYSDFGTPDELDRLEGTAMLDTIYIATAKDLGLAAHYGISDPEAGFKAAIELKKESRIQRSGYGELKIKVWDKDRNFAATIANKLLQKIQDLHRHLQNQTNVSTLQVLQNDYNSKQEQFRKLRDTLAALTGADLEIMAAKKTSLLQQLSDYDALIDKYQLAVATNPQVLMTVENARPSLWPDKPKTLVTVLVCTFAGFAFSFLLSLFLESRKQKA